MADYECRASAQLSAAEVWCPKPSGGFYHVAPELDVNGNCTIVRTYKNLSARVFANRFATMTEGVEYCWACTVHPEEVGTLLGAFERTTLGIDNKLADTLKEIKQVLGGNNWVKGILWDEEDDGFWVTLSGRRRFRHWEQLGYFSSTTAKFYNAAQFNDVELCPHERDISDLVGLNIPAILRAAKVVGLKRPLKHQPWKVDEAPAPYYPTHNNEGNLAITDSDYPVLTAPELPLSELPEVAPMPEHIAAIIQAADAVPEAGLPTLAEGVLAQPVPEAEYVHPLMVNKQTELQTKGTFWPNPN